MKTKTSQPLPPEEKSMSQAIKGVKFTIHYQVYYSSRVDETIKSDILLQDNGWIIGNENEVSSSIMVHWYVYNLIFAFP